MYDNLRKNQQVSLEVTCQSWTMPEHILTWDQRKWLEQEHIITWVPETTTFQIAARKERSLSQTQSELRKWSAELAES